MRSRGYGKKCTMKTDLNEIAREVNRHLPTSVDEILKRQQEQLEAEEG